MARNRIIYQNELLFVSPSATGNQNLNGDDRPGESLLRPIKRVQGINYGFAINRTDTYQYGQLARIDSKVLSSPTVSLDFSYYLTDGQNEHLLGFDTSNDSNFLHKDFINDGEGRNYYVYTAPEGRDAIGTIAQLEAQENADKSVVAIGNGFVSSYSLNAAVGGMPVVSISVQGSNIQADAGKAGQNPAINPSEGIQYTNEYTIPNEYIVTGEGPGCLLPGDIEVDLGDSSLLSTVTDDNNSSASHIQSVSMDLPLGRSNLERLGNAFGYAKVLDVPITASISVSAVLADKKSSSQSLFTELYAQNKSDLKIAFRKPSPDGSKKGDKKVEFTFHNAVLESESYGMSIGDNRTVDYVFSTTIGDPKASTARSDTRAGSIQVVSSGVYEQFQVLETGMSSDISNKKLDNIAYGHAVAANKDVLVIGASGFANSDFELGAAYIYKNKGGFYTQVQQTSGQEQAAGLSNASYIPGVNKDQDTNFGMDVAVSPGNLIAVANTKGGENTLKLFGAVSIFHPDDDNLESFTVRDIVTGDSDDGDRTSFGSVLAFDKEVSGKTQWMAIGAPLSTSGDGTELGTVHIRYGVKGETNSFAGYELSKTSTEIHSNLGANVHDSNERFGTSVAMHKGVVVAGAPGFSAQSGVAYVYAADGTGPHTAATSFVEVQMLTGVTSSDSNPAFGHSVDIFNNTIAVGAPSGAAGGSNRGEVYIYTTAESPYRKWTYQAKVQADDAAGGNKFFGDSVSMPNETTLVVGAPGEDDVDVNAGSVYVFTGAGSSWTQTQKITYTGSAAQDQAGDNLPSLATTQKDIFVGGIPATAKKERVIRYRI